ncbi:MAG: hypothetical protein MK137_02665 [Rickettsiales bacterium]|nr:hypothetical protein [Rickettsiales bacterium]
MKKIRHLFEFLVVKIVIFYLRCLSIDNASALGGAIARKIGPMTKAHKVAKKNLHIAFPDIRNYEEEQILEKMWDNLGRVCAEIPHLAKLDSDEFFKRVKHIDPHYIADQKESENGAFFMSAHYGNWELLARTAYERSIDIITVYRAPNNPYVDKIIRSTRDAHQDRSIQKGKEGAKDLIRCIKNKRHIGLLIDQKMNDGIAVPFFGKDAMTAPAMANLALKYDVPVIPVRMLRTNGAYFEAKAYPPLTFERTGDMKEDIRLAMCQINLLLEEWIREHPEQWFWVHNRWPKETT